MPWFIGGPSGIFLPSQSISGRSSVPGGERCHVFQSPSRLARAHLLRSGQITPATKAKRQGVSGPDGWKSTNWRKGARTYAKNTS